MGFSELGVDEIDNYGVKNEGLGYTDYRLAHHEENTLINPDEVDYKQYKLTLAFYLIPKICG